MLWISFYSLYSTLTYVSYLAPCILHLVHCLLTHTIWVCTYINIPTYCELFRCFHFITCCYVIVCLYCATWWCSYSVMLYDTLIYYAILCYILLFLVYSTMPNFLRHVSVCAASMLESSWPSSEPDGRSAPRPTTAATWHKAHNVQSSIWSSTLTTLRLQKHIL